MQAAKDHVVRFHYRVLPLPAADTVLEASERDAPAAVLLGHGALPPALEEVLNGRCAGERVTVDLTSERAFGSVDPQKVQRISRKHVVQPARPRAGEAVLVSTPHGLWRGRVLKVGMSVVDVDFNHPLAGRDLRFEIEVVEVRAATPEELAHGHAHGPGGHSHD